MGDGGAQSPAVVIIIVLLTLTFEGLYYGSDLATQSYPAPSNIQTGSCGGGGLDRIACVIGGVFEFIVNVVKIIFGTVAFVFNLITFNVPGAPLFVRIPIGGMITLAILWSVASLVRGS